MASTASAADDKNSGGGMRGGDEFRPAPTTPTTTTASAEGLRPRQPLATFAISCEDLPQTVGGGVGGNGAGVRSRFKVEHVGEQHRHHQRHHNHSGGDGGGGGVHAARSSSTLSVADHGSPPPYAVAELLYDGGSGGAHNLGYGQNTLDTLPHADHYRNVMTATGVLRKRPTLLELHEIDAAVSEDGSSSNMPRISQN